MGRDAGGPVGFMQEFREFAVTGNAFDMAVGIVLGVAFGDVVRSLVDNILTPPLGLLFGGVALDELYFDLSGGGHASLAEAKAAGAVVITYGQFLNTVIAFVLVALALFLVVRWVNRLRRPRDPEAPSPATTRPCPFCRSMIALEATRCPRCTSELPEGA